MSGQVT